MQPTGAPDTLNAILLCAIAVMITAALGSTYVFVPIRAGTPVAPE
jgi:hypothetical protein